jgi:hypothetical protein
VRVQRSRGPEGLRLGRALFVLIIDSLTERSTGKLVAVVDVKANSVIGAGTGRRNAGIFHRRYDGPMVAPYLVMPLVS